VLLFRPPLFAACCADTENKGYGDGPRRKQAPFPFAHPLTVDHVAGLADRLWKELVGADDAITIRVSHLWLGFTGVEPGEAGQTLIEGFFRGGAKPVSTSAVKPASAGAKNNLTSSTPISISSVGLVGSKPTSAKAAGKRKADDAAVDNYLPSFVCPRCEKRIIVDADAFNNEHALSRGRLEHDDFHFAQDLAREGPGLRVGEGLPAPVLGKEGATRTKKKRKEFPGKKKAGEGEGIARFFVKR
jgi:DNA polymerase eta